MRIKIKTTTIIITLIKPLIRIIKRRFLPRKILKAFLANKAEMTVGIRVCVARKKNVGN